MPLNITRIAVFLNEKRNTTPGREDRLLAIADVILDDCFVVREWRIIDGNGTKSRFVCPPSRYKTDRCPTCDYPNAIRANYCGNCGDSLPTARAQPGRDGRPDLYQDCAHPLTRECRAYLQEAILKEYDEEVARRDLGFSAVNGL
jgi:stage V sporulation protein G